MKIDFFKVNDVTISGHLRSNFMVTNESPVMTSYLKLIVGLIICLSLTVL